MRRLLLLATLLLTACPAPKPSDDTGLAGEVDMDGDGYPSAEDCDDGDAAVFPGAQERCNGYDDDCDGFVDDEDPGLDDGTVFHVDGDDDGFGSMAEEDAGRFCVAPGQGWVEDATDCDDSDPDIFPGAQEYCNLLDDDCDGEIDEEGALDSAWYLDGDGDGFGDETQVIEQCEQPSGYVLEPGDCDDGDGAVFPGADEYCNEQDDDCDGEIDEDGAVDAPTWYADGDGDGYGDPGLGVAACHPPSGYLDDASDCDDGEPSVFPGADEYCNERDDDCDGEIDEVDPETGAAPVDAPTWYADLDGDGFGDPAHTTAACDQPSGYLADSSDCLDTHPESYPGADELCDGLDNDCDGVVDEEVVDGTTWYLDADGDGFGDAASSSSTDTCDQPSGYVADDSDCDDGDASVHPYADEHCDGADDDCDGVVDEASAVDAPTWYADVDSDGYGDSALGQASCSQPSGYVADDSDCNDLDSLVHPGADELCDGLDNDCDGDVDEADAVDAATWYADADGDGYGDVGATTVACSQPSGHVADTSDCADDDAAIFPGSDERCDGVDNDCDGDVDEDSAVDVDTFYADTDGDGYGDAGATAEACSAPSGYVADASDCDDGDAATHPGADEHCDGTDDDCDGIVDEADAVDAPTWYTDGDGDGYGAGPGRTACSQPSGSSAVDGDCDDADASASPAADESCDGVDNDCDGDVDEADAVDAATWYTDGDGDGFGDAASPQTGCTQPSGTVSDSDDCDDDDASVYPRADEYCNGVDDDCDGDVDEADAVDAATWYRDGDGDGFGRSTVATAACDEPSGFVADATDCDDTDDTIHPGADEYCDLVDHDCDGSVDAGAVDVGTWYSDSDGDGYGDGASSVSACTQPSGTVGAAGDCDDGDSDVNPGQPELCNGVDDDCDGAVDGSGLVTFFPSSGAVSDYSAAFAAGTASAAHTRSLSSNGLLVFCPGTYYAEISLRAADLTLQGLAGSTSTVVAGDGSGAVITSYSTNTSLTVEGLTIQDGSGSDGGCLAGGTHSLDIALDDVVIQDCSASDDGGGLFRDGSGSLTATDLVLSGNTAADEGGGMYARGLDISLDGAEILGNYAADYGGGAYLRDSEVWIEAADVTGNTAERGAGLMLHTCSSVLLDSDIASNECVDYGGGLYVTYGDALLDESRVWGNASTGSSSYYWRLGGGLFLNNGTEVTCEGSSSSVAGVYDNQADYGGGAYLNDGSSLLVSDVCDWGSGSNDNEEDDVWMDHSWYRYTSYGADASFTCTGSSCY
jgi:hypothetical protein